MDETISGREIAVEELGSVELEYRINSLRSEATAMMNQVFSVLLKKFTSGIFGLLMRPLVKLAFRIIGERKMRKNVIYQQDLLIKAALELIYDLHSDSLGLIIDRYLESLLEHDNIFTRINHTFPESDLIKQYLRNYYVENIRYIAKILSLPVISSLNNINFLNEAIDPEEFSLFVKACEFNFNKISEIISKKLNLLEFPLLFRRLAFNAIETIYDTIIKGYQQRYDSICNSNL